MEMLIYEGVDLIFISWNIGIDFFIIENGFLVEILGFKVRFI